LRLENHLVRETNGWKTIWKPSGNHLETTIRLAIDSYPIDSIDVLVEV
jgi:hypothetical protein